MSRNDYFASLLTCIWPATDLAGPYDTALQASVKVVNKIEGYVIGNGLPFSVRTVLKACTLRGPPRGNPPSVCSHADFF